MSTDVGALLERVRKLRSAAVSAVESPPPSPHRAPPSPLRAPLAPVPAASSASLSPAAQSRARVEAALAARAATKKAEAPAEAELRASADAAAASHARVDAALAARAAARRVAQTTFTAAPPRRDPNASRQPEASFAIVAPRHRPPSAGSRPRSVPAPAPTKALLRLVQAEPAHTGSSGGEEELLAMEWSEVVKANGDERAWAAIGNGVYDLSAPSSNAAVLSLAPGAVEGLQRYAGGDATSAFLEYTRGAEEAGVAEALRGMRCVGRLVAPRAGAGGFAVAQRTLGATARALAALENDQAVSTRGGTNRSHDTDSALAAHRRLLAALRSPLFTHDLACVHVSLMAPDPPTAHIDILTLIQRSTAGLPADPARARPHDVVAALAAGARLLADTKRALVDALCSLEAAGAGEGRRDGTRTARRRRGAALARACRELERVPAIVEAGVADIMRAMRPPTKVAEQEGTACDGTEQGRPRQQRVHATQRARGQRKSQKHQHKQRVPRLTKLEGIVRLVAHALDEAEARARGGPHSAALSVLGRSETSANDGLERDTEVLFAACGTLETAAPGALRRRLGPFGAEAASRVADRAQLRALWDSLDTRGNGTPTRAAVGARLAAGGTLSRRAEDALGFTYRRFGVLDTAARAAGVPLWDAFFAAYAREPRERAARAVQRSFRDARPRRRARALF